MPFFKTIAQDIRAYNKPATPWHAAYLLLFSNGFLVVFLYRLYAPLYRFSLPTRIIAKIIERFGQILTNCYLEPMANIAGGLHLPHATGVVIGAGVTLHQNVTLYQHVTLGRQRADTQTAPTLGTGTTVYANAIIVGDVTLPPRSIVKAQQVVHKNA